MVYVKIAIYNGEGAEPGSLKEMKAQHLSEEDFFQTRWDLECTHFILPGGRDRPYHRSFCGEGNRKLRSFVEKGGVFIGICAGAYYACALCDFERGFPLEVCEKRELCFFNGSAVGPAFGKGIFTYDSKKGAKATKIQTKEGAFYAYYNGGPTFQGDFTGCTILGEYADLKDHPPAIIECKVGKGKAILSGVHLEISADAFADKTLASTNTQRTRFWLSQLSQNSSTDQMEVEMKNNLS